MWAALTALFVVLLIMAGRCDRALPLTLIAGCTDAVDGYLARRLGSVSRLGVARLPAVAAARSGPAFEDERGSVAANATPSAGREKTAGAASPP